MRITLKLIPIVFLAVLFFCGSSYATTITSVATDLTDTTVGEDLWQYEYTVSDNTFNEFEGFTIWFDYNIYGALDPFPSSPNSDWDLLTLDPDSSIPDDGSYDAMALTDGASLANSFIVSFVWLGGGTPGPQTFDVYNSNFEFIESGDMAPVPEPGTMLLFGIGLLGLVGFGRKSASV